MIKSKPLVLLIFLAVAAAGLYLYWRHQIEYPATSDAYITAHVVRIRPQVSGRLTHVFVQDHQHVKPRQLLLQIDAQPYQIAVQRTQAELALAQQQKLAAVASVQAANAGIRQRQAQLDNARRNYKHDVHLLASKSVSQNQTDSAGDIQHEAAAALALAQANYSRALREQDEADASISIAKAALAQARLSLSYTTIKAPAAGMLGKVPVRPGDVVQPGQQLFPLVEDQTFWVNANYKETDLNRIRLGQPASISVDMYPDRTFHGIVVSLSPASGAAFSLLPPENATGNWVKVTQRFPVRIRITNLNSQFPLRIGASCSVFIDTTGSTQLSKPMNSSSKNGK